jgi:hypothetical protein
MKATKIMAIAVAFAGTLAFTSCNKEGKNDNAPDTISNTSDAVPEGMSSKPGADTIVKKNGDTIVSTKADAPNQNPVGEQVP